MWRRDVLPAVTAEVTITKIVGDDEKNVRPLVWRIGGVQGSQRSEQQGGEDCAGGVHGYFTDGAISRRIKDSPVNGTSVTVFRLMSDS
jgi:hypothetical protein